MKLRQVSKAFAPTHGTHVQALAGVDLVLASGEIVAVVGTSGCGKSTLLRIAAGLERSHTGTVEVDGKAVTGQGPGSNAAYCFKSID